MTNSQINDKMFGEAEDFFAKGEQTQMTNQIPKRENNRFDLEERTARFGERMIDFCKLIRQNEIIRPLTGQIIRSSTSIGANYMEANGADSKKDFKNKISICKKEAKETMHWLRMLAKALPEQRETLRVFWQEAYELSLIFGAINRKLEKKF